MAREAGRKIEFVADFDHQVGRSIVAYKRGHKLRVPKAHADAAVAAGAAVELARRPPDPSVDAEA